MRTCGGRPWQPSDRRSGEITVSSSRWRLRAHGEGMRVQHQQPRYRNRGSHGLKRNARGEPHGCIDEGGSPQNGNSTIPARKPCGWTLSDVAVRTGCVGSTSETGLASRRGGKAFRSQTLYGPFVVLLKAASYTEIPLFRPGLQDALSRTAEVPPPRIKPSAT